MQKHSSPYYLDMESGWFNERPMGARLPRSMDEVYRYGRLIGMSHLAAQSYAKCVSAFGLGITQKALDRAEAVWREEQEVLKQLRLDMEERARQAAIRSPNTKCAIASRKRRQLQKAAARKRK